MISRAGGVRRYLYHVVSDHGTERKIDLEGLRFFGWVIFYYISGLGRWMCFVVVVVMLL